MSTESLRYPGIPGDFPVEPIPYPLAGAQVKLNLVEEDWAAAGSVDTDLSFLSFFKVYRTDVAQC